MKDYTHISIVLDRSGSMETIKTDVIGGFNNFLKEQKDVKGKATLTLAQFDEEYNVLQDFKEIASIDNLSVETFVPRGWTALLDAMGTTLNSVREKILAMDEEERPEKAIFVFITDGQENSSKKYSRKEVFEMISDLKENGNGINWEFVFLGANQDAIKEGSNYGIRSGASLSYDASSSGATMAFSSLSSGMTSYRCCVSSDAKYSFSDEDKKKQDAMIKGEDKAIPDYISGDIAIKSSN